MFRHTVGYVNGVGDLMMLIFFAKDGRIFIIGGMTKCCRLVSCGIMCFSNIPSGDVIGNTERERERENVCEQISIITYRLEGPYRVFSCSVSLFLRFSASSTVCFYISAFWFSAFALLRRCSFASGFL